MFLLLFSYISFILITLFSPSIVSCPYNFVPKKPERVKRLHFCVYCFYEAVDTMPSPEFRRSFPIGRIFFVLTFQMRSLIPSPNIIQSQQGYENCLLCLRRSSEQLVALDGVRNLRFSTFNQKRSNKEMTTCDLH